jgi:hypothetical protein
MNTLLHYTLFLSIGLAVAQNEFNAGGNNICKDFLTTAGVSPKFAGSVAHAVHSMTLKDLKKFYPSASQNNKVPTVNKNLTAPEAILLYAPDESINAESNSFITDGMNVLDTVLSRMDNKFWGIKNYSPLEKLVHAFHMKEVWARALNEYQLIEKNPPKNVENVCRCALDIERNGIIQIMKFLALTIREPSLMSANPTLSDFNLGDNFYRFDFNYYLTKLSNDNSRETSMPHLNSTESWQIWKKMVPREESYDAALFLYCAAKAVNGV